MKNKFGVVEMIGATVLLIIDPSRTNNKKYLQSKYYAADRIVGIITIAVLVLGLIYLVIKYM